MKLGNDDRQRRAQLQLREVTHEGNKGQDCDGDKCRAAQFAIHIRFFATEHPLQFAATILDSLSSVHALPHFCCPACCLGGVGGVSVQ